MAGRCTRTEGGALRIEHQAFASGAGGHHGERPPDNEAARIASRWLSRDFTALLERQGERPESYDLVVVGSGYGGAMAAAELAGTQVPDGAGWRPARVCVLERGKEYLPGAFPSRLGELASHVRFHRAGGASLVGTPEALLDFRAAPAGVLLVGNGLGGGSLINAGVMEEPHWDELGDDAFPPEVAADLRGGMLDEVRERLGGTQGGVRNDVHHSRAMPAGPDKTRWMATMGGDRFRPAAITVAMGDQVNAQGVRLQACQLCGDCLTGCNAGAKKSLDTNLLAQAAARGAEIYTGASVLKLERAGAGWILHVGYTNAALHARHGVLQLRASKVILAAGALGSTELLMRSRSDDLQFSPGLGTRFSGNGDSALLLGKLPMRANSAASAADDPAKREIGPTITGVVDMPPAAGRARFLLQELSVPAPLRHVWDEIVTTAGALEQLAAPGADRAADAPQDPYAVHARDADHSLLLGIIGHDASDGVLGMDAHTSLPEGALHLRRSPANGSADAKDALQAAADFVRASRAVSPESVISPNPFWRGLPESLTLKPAAMNGPTVSVHPLGGCAMGSDPQRSVVDALGRVYDAARPGQVHAGLVVLDGAIVPRSLAANPALTIAALALRSSRKLRDAWGWQACARPPQVLPPRPRAAAVRPWTPDRATVARISERLVGTVPLQGRQVVAELTLHFAPFALRGLFGFDARLHTGTEENASLSTLRLFDHATWHAQGLEFADDAQRERFTLARAEVEGTLDLRRQPSSRWQRVRRALPAWLWNRGLGDLFAGSGGTLARQPLRSLRWMWRVAARAGEVRCLSYSLVVRSVSQPGPALLRAGDVIAGAKTFTYSRRGHPLRQLLELQLEQFPGRAGPGVLRLDGHYLTRTPFIQLAEPQDFTVALADFGALGLYLLRMALGMHLWSFRLPQPGRPGTPQRLPGALPGLPPPEIHEVPVAPATGGLPVVVRLTRYRRAAPERRGPPLLMLHGYSASGTTYAHPALPLSMADYFWRQGRDVWVVDLRTSAGLPTAQLPWQFEDVALQDIPAAVRTVCESTGAAQVDVFAHCIGSVMLSMALLAEDTHAAGPHREALEQLPRRIRRIVLSQKAPALVYSEGNSVRAYLFRRLRSWLPEDFQFDTETDSGRNRALDRLLNAALAYPDADFDRETGPLAARRARWGGFRRRMDALYARDFDLRDIADETLDCIRDLFGPLNIETVSHAMHFVERQVITNGEGRNVYVTAARLRERWLAEATLSVHGSVNGLVSAHTAKTTSEVMALAGVAYQAKVFEGFGHQDLLIGRSAVRMFEAVEEFLR